MNNKDIVTFELTHKGVNYKGVRTKDDFDTTIKMNGLCICLNGKVCLETMTGAHSYPEQIQIVAYGKVNREKVSTSRSPYDRVEIAISRDLAQELLTQFFIAMQTNEKAQIVKAVTT